MENRRIIGYAFFAIGILLAVLGLTGVAGNQALVAVVVGLAAVILGIVFFRRGK